MTCCSSSPLFRCSPLGWVSPETSRARRRSPAGESGFGRGHSRLSSRDGPRDRNRGSGDRDRPARSARQSTAASLWSRHACADDLDRRRPDDRAHGPRGPPERRHSRIRRTQIANLARAAAGGGSTVRVLPDLQQHAAARRGGSSFQAGPGSAEGAGPRGPGGEAGAAARTLGRTNEHHTPVAGGRRLRGDLCSDHPRSRAARSRNWCSSTRSLSSSASLPVCLRWLASRIAAARGSLPPPIWLVAVVAFTLLVNLDRGYPLLSLRGDRAYRGPALPPLGPRGAPTRNREVER